MSIQYVKTIDQLPKESDFECPICLENVVIDEIIDNIPNSVMCINGHRAHYICWSKCQKHACPMCKTSDMKFCKSILGYSYVERKG